MSIYDEAMSMKPLEKIHLIDELLKSLDLPNQNIDELWKREIEDRIKAYDKGEIESVSIDEVFSKYKKI
ncbi:MAG: addiction module protein [Candidatus Paceibacteria bacterium]|jgi:putative addiction module component (TIGR02574 family)